VTDLKLGLTLGVTDQQEVVTPPRHLIPPLVFPEVCVSLIVTMSCCIYLIWALILTANFSVYLTRRSVVDCRLFCLSNLDTLILPTDFCV
jgi:hypothetical protein